MLRRTFLGIVLASALPARADPPAALVDAARSQVGVTVTYDPAYVRLDFPGGDIDRSRGVCTDVLIRAFRDAAGIDLQLAVNRDMKAAFAAYPRTWGLARPDRNIDHRRVGNLATLFDRVGAGLPPSSRPADFLPGDIVAVMLPGNLPHVAIVSDRTGPSGAPMILHNVGRGAAEEDLLFAWPHTGRFRLDGAATERLARLGRP
ncbi:MAG: DUF1287 domain-containing protein [Paracoccaceae bacterium]|nr:MAG: DUF1287 domain-containing protein [Paracoccaceae bacterium]